MATVNDDNSTTKKPSKCMKNGKIPLILWVDGNIRPTEKKSKKLEEVAEEVHVIETNDEAIKFLKEKSSEKLTVVSSGYLGKGLVPSIHEMKQVEAIYIYCKNRDDHQKWAKEWTKIKGVHDDMLSLQESIQGVSESDRPEVEHRSPDRRTKSDQNLSLNKLDISFMYTKLFKDTLVDLERSQLCDSRFVETIQKRITSDSKVLSLLLKWTEKYNNEKFMLEFIQSSLFLRINWTLRTFQLKEIMNMGFMIHDLHQYIEKMHTKQRKLSPQENRAFKCQYRSQEDVDKMKMNLGGLFSFNEFLITYAERDFALKKTERATNEATDVKILFVINFDLTNRSIPFVRINPKDKDAIVLLSSHTIFRLVTLQQLDESPKVYEVRLELTNDTDDEQQKIVNRYFGNATKTYPAWYRIVKLLINLHQFPMAKTFCEIVLKDKNSSPIDQAQCYDQLGVIMAQEEAFDDALNYHQKAKKNLDVSKKADARILVNIFNNMAQVYQDKGDDSNAKKSYEDARNVFQKCSFDKDDVEEANVFDHFGKYCERREHISEATDWFNRSLEKRKKCLPSKHPDFVKSYVNIGRLHEQRQEFSRAAIFYEKASSIREKWLPEYLLKQNRPTETNPKTTQQ